jgi:hypothetical protein
VLKGKTDIVQSVQQAVFAEIVDFKIDFLSGWFLDRLVHQINF